MKKICLFIFLLNALISMSNAQNLNQESLSNLDIYVNGEKFTTKEGDTLNVSSTQIIVKISDVKTFDFGVLSFDYPKNFSFSFEEDFAYKNWTLDGNEFVFMYFEIGGEATLDMFIKEMVNKFGKKNCNVNDIEIKLGALDLKGRRINVNMFGEKLTCDMYKLDSNDYKSHFIAFQDSKKEDGSDSDESAKTYELINQTIKQKKITRRNY